MDGRSGDGVRCLSLKDLRDIEIELQNFVKDIVTEWDRRQIRSPMDKAIYETFCVPFDWVGDTDKVKKNGINAVVSKDYMMKAKKLLVNLVDK